MWDFDKLSLKYTSTQLAKLQEHVPIMKACPVCYTVFDAQSYVFRVTAIYPRVNATCSPRCKRVFGGRKNKRIVRDYVCGGCGNPFIPHPKKPHQQFCNKQCRGLALKGKKRPEVQAWAHKLVPPRGSVSMQGTVWLDSHNVPLREHLIKIGDKTYRVDGYNPTTNTIYEYLGSFWHGNPKKHNPEEINPINKQRYGELHESTMARLETFRQAGYSVVYEWS